MPATFTDTRVTQANEDEANGTYDRSLPAVAANFITTDSQEQTEETGYHVITLPAVQEVESFKPPKLENSNNGSPAEKVRIHVTAISPVPSAELKIKNEEQTRKRRTGRACELTSSSYKAELQSMPCNKRQKLVVSECESSDDEQLHLDHDDPCTETDPIISVLEHRAFMWVLVQYATSKKVKNKCYVGQVKKGE